ncbi:unnamed protein product, partial [marine sediment metagenome]
MKKILLWLLVLTMCVSMVACFSLAGCKAKAVAEEEAAPAVEEVEEETPAEEVTEEVAPIEEEVDPIALALEFAERAIEGEAVEYTGTTDFTVGVIMPQLDNDGWFGMYIGVLMGVIKTGVNFVTLDARNNVDNQLAMIEDLITRKVDAIVFVPVDSAALSVGVIKANEAGIPVVTMDRSTESGEVLALVESNN